VRSWLTKSIVPSKSARALDQHLLGLQVEVVGGLVEDQEVRRVEEHLRQHQARLLAAREDAHRLVDVVARNWKAPRRLRSVPTVRGGNAFWHLLKTVSDAVEQLERLLREVAHLQRGPSRTVPASGV
jgi:hypothetical protein